MACGLTTGHQYPCTKPIDWGSAKRAVCLRIGTPLEKAIIQTISVDLIFPMRTIKSQERLILTECFNGVIEVILVFQMMNLEN